MGITTFSKHYCVCIREDGTQRELARLGSVVTYKAIDYRSGHPVALQVIPLTSVDQAAREQFEEQARAAQTLDHINIAKVFDVRVEDEHIVFITEYLQGETVEAWIVAHGTMAPDAVVRIGLQVVSALAAAMFHGLTHRAIQPSNLMIVPGTNPEGEWPFVKLLNFGLAGLKLYSEENEPRELVPTIAPQFASPEQLEHGTVDFRSEIFSLGATMCFLLTGAVPLAGIPNENGVAERELPSVGKIPRAVRKVLTRMLRYNPEERPQDPVVFAEELRKCLQKVEPRHGARHFGVPLATELPSKVDRPRNRALAIGLASAALLLALGAATAVLIPTRLQSLLHRKRDLSTIGVAVGVPDSTPPASGQMPPAITTGQNATVTGPAVASTNQPLSSGTPESNLRVVTTGQNRPPSPASSAKPTNEAKAIAAKRSSGTSRRQGTSASRRPPTPPMRVGSMRAEFVGVTADGNWILQLPNGRTIVTPPVPNPDEAPIEKHRRVRRVVVPPREIPVDQLPPVVVLPPDTLQASGF